MRLALPTTELLMAGNLINNASGVVYDQRLECTLSVWRTLPRKQGIGQGMNPRLANNECAEN